ncbi:bifunctional transcriptional activator/DNA repair enzyme AdaA [Planococcus sp. YIM B11945]|uniref:bifunctional transcriptional activator/DNA repair enzyme AdaA n=1 Tax=Planococcus sp. YIM B11945 TaxID=3435410 RepID=UPI003D7E86C0
MVKEKSFSFKEMWEKIIACDRKYDGLFFTAVKTTGIYCRPSCRSRKPKKQNVEFYATLQEAESRGYRACKRCQPEVELSPNSEFTRKVISFLLENYRAKLSLEKLSGQIGMSPSYLNRLFKQETGETPRTYLEKVRIDKAANLLKKTNKTNLEICFEAGFQSPSHFYKAFRQLKNFSPSEYRKKNEEFQCEHEN